MKWLTRLTLQWRVTLLTALVLIASSIAFTTFSILNAQRVLITPLSDTYIGEADSNSPPLQTIKDNELEDMILLDDVSLQRVEHAKQEFDITSITFCIILTILGTGIVYFVSGKALRPVQNLSKQVSMIDEHNLSHRLPERIANDEIGSLANSFNHALDRLEEAFERQKRFSASAAHELKTPLATIKAGIQVLSLDESSTLPDYKENAHMTEASVNRMAQVVNDLLLLATAKEIERNDELIYIQTMFESIFAELSPIYDGRSITKEIDCNVETMNGNASLMYRAFYNLIENAYKYNLEKGNIAISIKNSNKYVKIEIADSGCGISQEHLPFIFEAFYRADASRSRKIAGSGLGLAIVKAIIERHKGTITVSSSQGKGTVFTILCPK